MVVLFALLAVAAGLYCWSATRKIMASTDPKHQHLARLLLVSANAFNDLNQELYKAAMREIVKVLCNERWGRAEIEWRIGQALLIVKRASPPENFEKVRRLGQNIIRATI